MKKILVPTDFSDCAYHALRVAAEIAKKTKAEIYLYHIIEIPEEISNYGNVTENIPEMMALIDYSKRGFYNLLHDGVLKDVPTVIEALDFNKNFQPVYSGIAKRTKQHDIDLIVMGSHGMKGFKENFIGSNTEKVLNLSSCPVFTVKKPFENPNFKDVIFASDFSEEAEEAFLEFKQLVDAFDAKIHFLKINTPDHFETNPTSFNKIKKFTEEYNLDNITINVYNDFSIEEGVVNFAKENDYQIIALASHGRKGLNKIINGNIAVDLINHADQMILSYKLKEKALAV